jgi:hypothetical protein
MPWHEGDRKLASAVFPIGEAADQTGERERHEH